MKILWLSNPPFMHTGYGTQTYEICSRLARDGHEIHIQTTAGLSPASGIIRWQNFTIYPPGRDPYGNDMARYVFEMVEADVLISLSDIFVLNPEDMPHPWAAWVTIDHDPLGAFSEKAALQACDAPIAVSHHGKRLIEQAGIGCAYIPHGIDTQVGFRPEPADGVLFRRHHSIPQDAFLITFVGYNRGVPPTRKGIEYLLQAVADLNKDGYEDIHVYMHTDPVPMGDMMGSLNIPKLATALDVGGSKVTVHIPDPRQHILGYPVAYMRALYNAGDVFCLPSGGEGFGLPLIEAQACGSPVICTDWTSMPELVGGGWSIPYAALQVAPNLGTKRAIVDVEALKGAILEARDMKMNHRGDWDALKRRARTSSDFYNVTNIYENMWRPFIKDLEAKYVSSKVMV